MFVIGGPSGAGKTHVSYALAQHFGISISEVDDLFHAVEALTTADQHPEIHFWRTHPEELESTPDRILECHLGVCRAMGPAIASVIRNHVGTRVPVVLEGDYILPELIAAISDRVRAVFLIEDDPDQIVGNLLRREPGEGEQRKRAAVSVLFGDWLQRECARFGFAAIPARPWKTVVGRTIEAARSREASGKLLSGSARPS